MPTAISITLLRLSVCGSVKSCSSGAAVTNSNRYHFKSVGAALFCLSGWGQWPGPTLATLGWAPFPPLRAAHTAAPAPGLTVGVMVERADIHGWLSWPNVSIPWRRWRREYARSISGVTAGGGTFCFSHRILHPRLTRFACFTTRIYCRHSPRPHPHKVLLHQSEASAELLIMVINWAAGGAKIVTSRMSHWIRPEVTCW